MPLLRKPSQGSAAPASRSATKSGAPTNGRAASKEPQSDPKSKPPPALAQVAAAQPTTAGGTAAADDYVVPVREVVRPANQLQLSQTELEEEVGRLLTAGNPAAPTNLVRFSFKERGYRPEPIIDQQLQHFTLGGCLLHADSEEAAKERQRQESSVPARRATQQPSRRATGTAASPEANGAAVVAEASLAPAGSSVAVAGSRFDDDSIRLRNQFNFADRAAQTMHFPPRERGTLTEPPPTVTASGSCSRWGMFEAYLQDQERQRQTEELARQKAQVARKGNAAVAALAQQTASLALSSSTQEQQSSNSTLPDGLAKTLERMVQQNQLKERIMDFRYWDDPADNVRADEGTLLPLWGDKDDSFTSSRIKRRAVTALCWSPHYFDLFAVGYGSFDFLNPTTGLVCCYSLKNPGSPEFTFSTGAGVMCLDFHPDHPSLLAVGCYDGGISIFDLRGGSEKPVYQSSARAGKHSDPVWQVCWQRVEGHDLQLHSISTDGRVVLWTVNKNELSFEDVLQLKNLKSREEARSPTAAGPPEQQQQAQQAQQPQQPQQPSNGGSRTSTDSGDGAVGIAGGCCFDFNREQEFMFVVGAEDGSLYKCSTAYTSQYLQAYRPGHHLPVYAVRWNTLHSRTFLSAGADWKVKLWDSVQSKPVMSFDLRAPVGDVAWAPFSSTVFAAVTDAGKVHVFDVAQSRSAAVCVQRVARKTRLTKLAFNPRHPVLLVGSEQGTVTCFKLSPNLRRNFNAEAAKAVGASLVGLTDAQAAALLAARQAESGRLNDVLSLARKCNAALLEDDWELM